MSQPRQYADHAARQRAYRARQEQARQEDHDPTRLPGAPALATVPARARWQALLGRAHRAIATVQTEMQIYWDARSEPWQESERGTAMADELEQLALVLDDLAACLSDEPGRGGG